MEANEGKVAAEGAETGTMRMGREGRKQGEGGGGDDDWRGRPSDAIANLGGGNAATSDAIPDDASVNVDIISLVHASNATTPLHIIMTNLAVPSLSAALPRWVSCGRSGSCAAGYSPLPAQFHA